MMHGYGEIAKIPVSDMGMVWIQLQMYWIFEKKYFFLVTGMARTQSGYCMGTSQAWERKKNKF